jgi:hypothetical protein
MQTFHPLNRPSHINIHPTSNPHQPPFQPSNIKSKQCSHPRHFAHKAAAIYLEEVSLMVGPGFPGDCQTINGLVSNAVT